MESRVSYRIRRAVEGDCEAIVKMLQDLAAYEKMLDQCKMTVEEFRRDGFGKTPAFYCHVAETKSEQPIFIGYALYYYIYSTWKGKNVYLEDLYVEKEYRGQGIGTEMLKAVAKVAVDNGCSQYRLACLGWNKALNLYKSLGANDLTESEDWHFLRYEKSEMESFARTLKNWEEAGTKTENKF